MYNHTDENNFNSYNTYNIQPMPVIYNLPIYFTPQEQNQQPIQQTLSRSLYDKPAYKKIISEDALSKITPKLYRELSDSDKLANPSCCISYDEFHDEDEVIQLECGHVFLKEPILHWLQNENSICPVCRFQFDSIEVKNTVQEEEHYDNYQEDENRYVPLVSILDILQQLYYDDI